jgi:hypothetical protein
MLLCPGPDDLEISLAFRRENRLVDGGRTDPRHGLRERSKTLSEGAPDRPFHGPDGAGPERLAEPEQLPVVTGIAGVRGHVEQRDECEGPLQQARMGDA